MTARPARGTSASAAARSPQRPRPPASLELATLPDHDLEDEATLRGLAFEVDVSGRTAESVEFDQCRFRNADLGGATLARARLVDCLIERTNLANMRVDKSSMQRVRVDSSRMTGLYWIDGLLRDVTVTECRADLAVFRFTDFRQVRFEDCNLTRADFQNADLSGTQFVNCDLTGAQFSQATMTGTRFRGCTLAGIGGVTSFDGVIIASHDLVALSYELAAGLGIQIEDDEGSPQ
jgi:uncharacterized protein YjbI with pentapeptide repeats